MAVTHCRSLVYAADEVSSFLAAHWHGPNWSELVSAESEGDI